MRFGLVCFAMFVVLASVSSLSAQQVTVTPAAEPFEVVTGQVESLIFNIQITEDGEPSAILEDTTVSVAIAGIEDEESGISLLPTEAEWSLFQGFKGGKRRVSIILNGIVPKTGTIIETTAVINIPNQEPQEVEISLQVRASDSETVDEKTLDFCIQPGRGEALESGYRASARLFPNFRKMQVIGSVPVSDAASATIAASMKFEVIELVNGAEYIPSDMELINSIKVIDSDDDGFAEAIVFQTKIKSPKIEVAPESKRYFEIRVHRTDILPVDYTYLGKFEVVPRESTDSSQVASIGGSGYEWAKFRREQSKPLSAKVVLLRNGVKLPAAAQATFSIEAYESNAEPTVSGLYDMTWVVHIDWALLSKIGKFEMDDTLSVKMRFPESGVAPLLTSLKICEVGKNAVYINNTEEILAKEYDNGDTEQTHLDALMEALCEAGLEVDEDGNISFPGLFEDPNSDEIDPNWPAVRRVQDAIRAAIQAYKNANRDITAEGETDAKDCLEESDDWEIEITLRKTNTEGEEVDVEVVIVIGSKGEEKASATDGKGSNGTVKPKKLVIAIGRCGKDNKDSSLESKGQDAGANVNNPGSLGIALGGNGGNEPDRKLSSSASEESRKGRGGHAGVAIGPTAEQDPDEDGTGGATGIALGGHGGDSEAQDRISGNGGTAIAEVSGSDRAKKAKIRSKSKVFAGGGNSGETSNPPLPTEKDKDKSKGYSSGGTVASNPNGVKGAKKVKKKGIVHIGGQAGKQHGGMARAETGKSASSTPGVPKRSGPITGD